MDIIIAINKCIKKEEPKIAVLTPYRAQKRLVEELVGENKLEVIVSTINESQGYNIIACISNLCYTVNKKSLVWLKFGEFGRFTYFAKLKISKA